MSANSDDEKAKRDEALRKAQEERQRALASYTYQNELAQLAAFNQARLAMQAKVNRALLNNKPDETE